MELLQRSGVEVAGTNVVVLGRRKIVILNMVKCLVFLWVSSLWQVQYRGDASVTDPAIDGCHRDGVSFSHQRHGVVPEECRHRHVLR